MFVNYIARFPPLLTTETEPSRFLLATITLKNIPPDLHRAMKKRAEKDHRSLNKEIIATLKSATDETHIVNLDAMIREARSARSKFKRQISAAEIDAWKRAGRF